MKFLRDASGGPAVYHFLEKGIFVCIHVYIHRVEIFCGNKSAIWCLLKWLGYYFSNSLLQRLGFSSVHQVFWTGLFRLVDLAFCFILMI